MQSIERLEMYENTDFDHIITLIRNGTIKAGRYSHLVKFDKNKKNKGKELFTNGKDE